MNHQGNVSSPQFTGHGKRAGVDAGQLAQDAAWMAARIQTALRQLSGVEAKTVAEAEVLRGPVCLLEDVRALLLAYVKGDPYGR